MCPLETQDQQVQQVQTDPQDQQDLPVVLARPDQRDLPVSPVQVTRVPQDQAKQDLLVHHQHHLPPALSSEWVILVHQVRLSFSLLPWETVEEVGEEVQIV